jgi:hypothetical protein
VKRGLKSESVAVDTRKAFYSISMRTVQVLESLRSEVRVTTIKLRVRDLWKDPAIDIVAFEAIGAQAKSDLLAEGFPLTYNQALAHFR